MAVLIGGAVVIVGVLMTNVALSKSKPDLKG